MVGIDCKRGVELAPFAARLSALATGPDHAVELLPVLVMEMEDRYDLIKARQGVAPGTPDELITSDIWGLPEGERLAPIVLFIDEVAELFLAATRKEEERAAQLAREFGAYVIGTGRAADRQTMLDFGAKEFVDLENDTLEDVGGIDLVFDGIGGDIGKRSAGLIRAGGTLVSIVGPVEAQPADGLAIDFVVESDRAQLSEIVRRVQDGRLRTNIDNVSTLEDAVAALNPTERRKGKTVIRVRP